MMQKDVEVPVDEETYWILTFLSDYGLWFILAIALVVVVMYKKFKD